ncbi:MAG: YggS family pyridoxal phosphate-dependent enzyme [Planctomycetaceae bacterium]
MPDRARLNSNYRSVLDRIAAACRRAGRSPDDVRLIAVTKSGELSWVETLVKLGARDLGESRPQQLVERARQLGGEIHWHLIGHLQRNKVRQVLPFVQCIHSIDSARLLTRVDEVAKELGVRPRVLLEVNVSGEASKGGFRPEELAAEWPLLDAVENVEIDGLMTMAPLLDDVERTRPVFRGLRELRDRLVFQQPAGPQLRELSMGMSEDFEIAVEEGATMVRVGSLLFEGCA